MRALLTGVNGFAGTHLAHELVRQGMDVVGVTGSEGWRPECGPLPGGVETIPTDVRDAHAVLDAIAHARPDVVFHLAAALALPPTADGLHGFDVNVHGTWNVAMGLARHAPRARLLVASSSAVYGAASAGERPIAETAALSPVTMYGASKVAQEVVARAAQGTFGLDVVITRAFNHSGPGESARYVASGFARQIAVAEQGGPREVRVGRLTTARDVLDVRDVVRAYAIVALRGESGGAYNVCSGRSVPVRELLETLVAASRVPLAIVEDPQRVQTADVPVQVGDPSRVAGLGFAREIPLSRTLHDLLDRWREVLAAEHRGVTMQGGPR